MAAAGFGDAALGLMLTLCCLGLLACFRQSLHDPMDPWAKVQVALSPYFTGVERVLDTVEQAELGGDRAEDSARSSLSSLHDLVYQID